MEYTLILVGIMLLIFSIIDLKFKAIPSIFLTAILFTVAVVRIENLPFGILSFIIAYLIYESNYFGGVADIKIMTMLGLLINSINFLFIMIFSVAFLGLIWKVAFKWRTKNEKEVAFVPVFLFVYILLFILGGIQ